MPAILGPRASIIFILESADKDLLTAMNSTAHANAMLDESGATVAMAPVAGRACDPDGA